MRRSIIRVSVSVTITGICLCLPHFANGKFTLYATNHLHKSFIIIIMSVVIEDDEKSNASKSIRSKGSSAEMFPRYHAPLAPAKPFLMPSFNDGDVVEILPSEKANRKIRFDENILVQEIENRFAFIYPEDDDEDSYEIEIVEDDGDADFYLEIVDGEVFYVFETEDDISLGSDASEDDMEEESDMSDEESESKHIQMNLASIPAPNLDADDYNDEMNKNEETEITEMEIVELEIEDTHKPEIIQEEELVVEVIDETEQDLDADELIKEQNAAKEIRPDDDTDEILKNSTQLEPSLEEQIVQEPAETVAAPSAEPTPSPTPVTVTPSPPPISKEDKPKATLLEEPQRSITPPPTSEIESTSSQVAVMTPTPESKEKVSVPPPPMEAPHSPSATRSLNQHHIVDSVPHSPIASPIAPASPSSVHRAQVKSILKANPESPKKPTAKVKRDKKSKGGKKEKTFTKTYVRADHYDGEHRVYTWEKPDWTKKQLRSTGLGEAVRKGKNLANPITFPVKKPANADLIEEEEKEDEMEKVDKEELIRRIKAGTMAIPLAPVPGYRNKQRQLKFSIKGATIRDGGDIVKPITKATVIRKAENINKVANPTVLKATPIGEQVRKGDTLAAPITKATVIRKRDDVNEVANPNVLKKKGVQPVEKKKYEWEKPSWVKPKLQSTDKGKVVKAGEKVEAPITHIEKSKKIEWEKPSWIKTKLGPTGKGATVKQGGTISNPITFPVGKPDGINKEVHPDEVLRHTELGDVVRQGENLARPITQLPELARKEERDA